MASPHPRPPARISRHLEVRLDGMAHGGEAVGRLPDGKACFVAYAIPGERVLVEIVEERRRWARARLVEVLDRSPHRVDPPCPVYGPDRCGGCRLQHVDPRHQTELKRRIVIEQLQRIGGIAEPPVGDPVTVADVGYRTQARFAVDELGRLGFRRAASREVVHVDACLLLTPETQALRDAAGNDWPGVEEVAIRSGCRPGEGMLVVRPGEGPLPTLPAGDTPVAVVDAAGRAVGLRGEAAFTEQVAGFEFRVSPTSFFQAGRAGAEALLAVVRRVAAARPGDVALDVFAGVGLFARGLAADRARVTAVEAHPAACADARANLAACEPRALVVEAEADAVVAQLAADSAEVDLIVLDPPRRGAGIELAQALAGLGAHLIVYVSCDPAALARDARALAEAGYRLQSAVVVDQFAQTAAIETVASFGPS